MKKQDNNKIFFQKKLICAKRILQKNTKFWIHHCSQEAVSRLCAISSHVNNIVKNISTVVNYWKETKNNDNTSCVTAEYNSVGVTVQHIK